VAHLEGAAGGVRIVVGYPAISAEIGLRRACYFDTTLGHRIEAI